MVERRRVGFDLAAVLVPPRLLGSAEPVEPRLARSAWVLDTVREDAQDGGAVADDAGVGCPVPAELRRVGMDVDELRVRRKAADFLRVDGGAGFAHGSDPRCCPGTPAQHAVARKIEYAVVPPNRQYGWLRCGKCGDGPPVPMFS